MELEKLGSDIATAININPIYFDLNKFNIRKDAKIELDKIVRILNEYPQMILELGSHTDCRESIAYNQILSDKRAASSINYIKKRISNPERIYGKGFGESRLVNDCACEGSSISDCSEEDHQLNRRTEFIVIKIGKMNISKSDEIKGEDGRNLSGINETVNKDNWNNTIEPKQNDSIYVVKKNDTLFRVYRITGVTVQKLKELNKLTSNRISEGQLLRLN
jgi:LysM repeat protein